MSNAIGTIKQAGDKIFLLVLLAAGLALAQGIISWRSQIQLSEPVELDETLLVQLPEGENWTRRARWSPGGQGFVAGLETVMESRSGPVVRLQLGYRLVDPEFSIANDLREGLPRGAELVESGSAPVGRLVFEWVHVRLPQQYADVFRGMIRLDSQQVLEIRTVSEISDVGVGKRVFMSVAHSLQYRPRPEAQIDPTDSTVAAGNGSAAMKKG